MHRVCAAKRSGSTHSSKPRIARCEERAPLICVAEHPRARRRNVRNLRQAVDRHFDSEASGILQCCRAQLVGRDRSTASFELFLNLSIIARVT